jgi:hypothetical protein
LRFDVIELPLWVGLPTVFLLCLLTCALVLDHVREAAGRRTAIEKGVALLKHWLSPAQLAQYQKYGYFEVRGGDSGERYRIRPTHQMNVDELNEQGMRTAAWCFGPEGELPIGDVMLAQKIALENDEQATLALANRGNPDQRPLRFG